MERLTEKHYLAEDHYMKCSEDCNVDMDCVDCPAFDKLIERLAAYEDTGLTPERCAEFARADAEGRYIVMRDAEQDGVARLRELAEADKDGRLVVRMAELKPCPFCGGKVSIVLCDDEGNLHDEAYRERPYSGIGFMLHHAHEDNPECPIASYECDGGILGGVYIYDTEEKAVEAWNRRVNDD